METKRLLFPNGVGTRFLLATAVVVGVVWLSITSGDVGVLKDLAIMAFSFYFIEKAANGKK